MAKKTGKAKGQKRTPSKRRAGSGARAAARSGAGTRRTANAKRNTGRRTAGAKTPKGKAARKSTRKATSGGAARNTSRRRKSVAARKAAPRRRVGGTGRERDLAQTPETGRTVIGRTNPMPTKRSTGTPAGAGSSRRAPALDRARRRLRELDETVPSPPSSLSLDRTASAARTGRREMREALEEHNETSPVLTGGDVDADWEDAYAVGDEAPGGDNPTPDQDRVDDIGKALGVEYQDNEELRAADKVADRDRHRWELDPASSEDYRDRD
jgi:hypothetical protein